MRGWIFLTLWVITGMTLGPITSWGYSEAECVECHGSGSEQSELQIDMNQYAASLHGREISCSDCHQTIEDISHMAPDFSETVDCKQCHDQDNLHAPDQEVTCADCHTGHYVFENDDLRSTVHPENLERTCGTCHPDQVRNNGLLDTLVSIQIVSHPKQDFSEDFSGSRCLGCHQGKAAHGEDGQINDQKCHTCHMDLKMKKALLGYIHPGIHGENQAVNRRAAYISLLGLSACILLFFIMVFRFTHHRKK